MNKSMILMLFLAGVGPAVKAVDDDGYVPVRADVFRAMNLAEENLPKCEASLAGSEAEIVRGQAAVDDMTTTIARLRAHNKELNDHITYLEGVIKTDREPDVVDRIGAGWEAVDGTAGLFTGWGVGTVQCLGILYVLNQPAFRVTP